MELTAKVLARLEKRSGTSANSKSWVSQDFVVEHNYDSQYPKKAVLNFFGEERVREAQELLHKDTIAKFNFDISAREITLQSGEKRWVQSLDCYRITIPNAAPTPAPAPAPEIPAEISDAFEQVSDDLPF